MGREIRMVPPNWEHPKTECKHSPWRGGCDEAKLNGGKCAKPLYDKDFETASKVWKDGLAAHNPQDHEGNEFWEWDGGPPDRAYYRPKWDESEATWFQMYETVSEGTPITPAFATKAELVDYLVAHGDYWNQHAGEGGWKRENAERFVEHEWAPSMIVVNGEIQPMGSF